MHRVTDNQTDVEIGLSAIRNNLIEKLKRDENARVEEILAKELDYELGFNFI